MQSKTQLRNLADIHLVALRQAGLDPYLIGGLLRVEQLGGETSDVDIALLVSPQSYKNVRNIVERLGGFEIQHECDSPYAHTAGFLADFRWGDTNLIIYNSMHYPTIQSLVASFDLNINRYYEVAGVTYNDEFNGVVTYNAHPLHIPKPERVARFKVEYPHLDWSGVNV